MTDLPWNRVLAPLIIEHLYNGGPPPEGWTLAQDLRICKTWLAKRTQSGPADLEAFLKGLRKLYPTGKMTLKLLLHDPSLYSRALSAHFRTEPRGPRSLGSLLREAVERG